MKNVLLQSLDGSILSLRSRFQIADTGATKCFEPDFGRVRPKDVTRITPRSSGWSGFSQQRESQRRREVISLGNTGWTLVFGNGGFDAIYAVYFADGFYLKSVFNI